MGFLYMFQEDKWDTRLMKQRIIPTVRYIAKIGKEKEISVMES